MIGRLAVALSRGDFTSSELVRNPPREVLVVKLLTEKLPQDAGRSIAGPRAKNGIRPHIPVKCRFEFGMSCR